MLCHGTPDEVLANPEARKYYFGEGMDLGHRGPPPPHQPAALRAAEQGLGTGG